MEVVLRENVLKISSTTIWVQRCRVVASTTNVFLTGDTLFGTLEDMLDLCQDKLSRIVTFAEFFTYY